MERFKANEEVQDGYYVELLPQGFKGPDKDAA